MALLKKRGTFSKGMATPENRAYPPLLFARERGGGLVPYFNFSKISV